MNPWQLLLDLLGGILAFFYDIIPNYGVSIILLTLLVGIALFPLTYKQTKSMKGMQDLQPEVKRLQKEYKDDREELNKQLMALYQERGVNPAAGCLPLLVQMPIWFALYRVLWQGSGIPDDSELKGVITAANEALYVTDPSTGELTTMLQPGVDIAADQFSSVMFLGLNLLVRPSAAVDIGNILGSLPYIMLIAVIVVAGFYQQVQTTRRRTDDGDQEQTAQMQTMQRALRIMPIVFGFISWNFVSGLGLYFATSSIFRVGQQAVILRTTGGEDKDDGDDGPGKEPPEEPSDEPKSSGPSQNASKKRNRKRRK
ncbi:MAG: YidC/Oxa1 family membrane protein insertase [Acidimicrobiia bacterium]|nr:YidC/Oxa1 family membrane protein insertase [Acidimicrobiia bacterium]